jgi:hypothetical protein
MFAMACKPQTAHAGAAELYAYTLQRPGCADFAQRFDRCTVHFQAYLKRQFGRMASDAQSA